MKRLLGITIGILMIAGLIASPALADPSFTTYSEPNAEYMGVKYVEATTKIDISGLTEHSDHSSITDGNLAVTFSTPMEKLTVPDSWSTWASPPHTENSTPHVLFTNGVEDMTMTMDKPCRIFGFELQPNYGGDYPYVVDFVLMDGSAVVGTVSMEVGSPYGARLFAARVDGGSFDKIVIDCTAGYPGADGFAIAQVRYDTLASSVTDCLLLCDKMLQISGSNVVLDGDIHSNKKIQILGSEVNVTGSQTTSPEIALPDMADYVPATGAATETLEGDQKLEGAVTYSDGSVIWVKGGKLEIDAIGANITGKVWFLVDKEVVVKGDLIPANEDSSIHIYTEDKVEVSGSDIEVEGMFLAGKDITLSGSGLELTGLFWATGLVDISCSNSELTGAVISNKLLKVSGSDFKGTYNPGVISISP